jgi:monofunctional biosynthetic peptidoglycan transglycosylase
VDWGAVEEAIDDAEERGDFAPRGASTIPMQTARNLFLWQARSYVRKAIEVPLAYAMNALWPKRRMIEVYLNIAEWGPGVFGAEAAARFHFKRSAARVTGRQAAQMAAALPNPHVRNAGRPGPRTRRLVRHIERRMARETVRSGCVYP